MQPFVIVIFGATGDLARHKLFPALFSLFLKGQLGSKFYIVGFARRNFTDEEYRSLLKDKWQVNAGATNEKWEEFAKNVYYSEGYFDELAGYEQLNKKLNQFDKEIGACITRLFYLATPPDNYLSILKNLKDSRLSEARLPSLRSGTGEPASAKGYGEAKQGIRLAIEKPFGKDIDNAREIDLRLAEIFEEKQIYRVDHYLAKETVQNIMAFRFANGIFEPVWNNNYLDHVQITFAEKKGVGERGSFFDAIGILRDVAQNHLLQLLATVAMEQPKSFSREAVRDARAAAIKAIRWDSADSVVRGQYKGYKDEPEVASDSTTETFAAMKFFVDS